MIVFYGWLLEENRNYQKNGYNRYDGFDLWQKKADELNRVGFNVKVSPFVTNHAIEPTDDICDILMRVKEPISAPVVDDVPQGNKVLEPQQSEQETTLNRMIGKNPNLQVIS
jgi:hypothetical protein